MDSTALALIIAGFGVLLIALSFQRQMQHDHWPAASYGIVGAAMFLLGAVMFAIALNINTYERSPSAQALAQISIERTPPQGYRVTLMRIPSGDLQVFKLDGDAWHLTVQQLNWQGWPNLIGMQTNTRLFTLVSNGMGANLYSLSRNPGIDLGAIPPRFPGTQRFLHTRVLISDDLPLQDGLRYHVYITDKGLEVKVINQLKDRAAS